MKSCSTDGPCEPLWHRVASGEARREGCFVFLGGMRLRNCLDCGVRILEVSASWDLRVEPFKDSAALNLVASVTA